MITAMTISAMGEEANLLKKLLDIVNELVMRLVMLIMPVVPLGVFSLIAKSVYDMNRNPEGIQGLFMQIGKYFFTVMLGHSDL